MSPTQDRRQQRKSHDNFQCRLCKQYHALKRCRSFLRMSTEKRMRAVLLFQYCSNCLAHEHSQTTCLSETGCHRCSKNHHTLLHMDDDSTTRLPRLKRNTLHRAVTTTTFGVSTIINQHVVSLMPTAVIKVQSGGLRFSARALLDPCTSNCRITKSLATKLGLSTIRVGDDSICQLTLRSLCDHHLKLEITAQILHRIQIETPSKALDSSIKSKFSNLVLADPEFYKPQAITIILGNDIYHKIIKTGVISGSNGIPLAQDTIFGWVVSGPCAR